MLAHTLVMKESALEMRIYALEVRLYGGYARSETERYGLEQKLATARTSLRETQVKLAALKRAAP